MTGDRTSGSQRRWLYTRVFLFGVRPPSQTQLPIPWANPSQWPGHTDTHAHVAAHTHLGRRLVRTDCNLHSIRRPPPARAHRTGDGPMRGSASGHASCVGSETGDGFSPPRDGHLRRAAEAHTRARVHARVSRPPPLPPPPSRDMTNEAAHEARPPSKHTITTQDLECP